MLNRTRMVLPLLAALANTGPGQSGRQQLEAQMQTHVCGIWRGFTCKLAI